MRTETSKKRLMIPGPIDLEPEVLAALAQQVTSHYGSEWVKLYSQARDALRPYAQTDGQIFMLAASGSAGIDAAVGSMFAQGERVLTVVNGYFSERLYLIAKANGLVADPIRLGPGFVASHETIDQHLSKNKYAGLLICHSETATGTLHDIEAISSVTSKHGVALLVDAVSSFGACEIRMDDWDISVCCTASQKALAAPPGLAPIAVSDASWDRIDRTGNTGRGWYKDLRVWRDTARDSADYHPHPATMPVNIVRSLVKSLELQTVEEPSIRFERMQKSASSIRARLRELGYQPVAIESAASPTVTCFYPPPQLKDRAEEIATFVEEETNLVLARGTGELVDKVIRIGHMTTRAYGEYADDCLESLERFIRVQPSESTR